MYQIVFTLFLQKIRCNLEQKRKYCPHELEPQLGSIGGVRIYDAHPCRKYKQKRGNAIRHFFQNSTGAPVNKELDSIMKKLHDYGSIPVEVSNEGDETIHVQREQSSSGRYVSKAVVLLLAITATALGVLVIDSSNNASSPKHFSVDQAYVTEMDVSPALTCPG